MCTPDPTPKVGLKNAKLEPRTWGRPLVAPVPVLCPQFPLVSSVPMGLALHTKHPKPPSLFCRQNKELYRAPLGTESRTPSRVCEMGSRELRASWVPSRAQDPPRKEGLWFMCFLLPFPEFKHHRCCHRRGPGLEPPGGPGGRGTVPGGGRQPRPPALPAPEPPVCAGHPPSTGGSVLSRLNRTQQGPR